MRVALARKLELTMFHLIGREVIMVHKLVILVTALLVLENQVPTETITTHHRTEEINHQVAFQMAVALVTTLSSEVHLP